MSPEVKNFIQKWNNRMLQDDGAYVSVQFKSFQRSFFTVMKKIAKSLQAELVYKSYGHYDMSGFIKRGDNCVYFSYSNSCCLGGRTYVTLTHCPVHPPMYFRTAANEKDFRGGANHHCFFEDAEKTLSSLLNQKHIPK